MILLACDINGHMQKQFVHFLKDLKRVLDHFEFKIYQNKRKINFAMYQSKKIIFIMLSEKILQCIRENFIMYQSKFYNVSEKIL